MTLAIDPQAELARKVQNVARSLHFELVLQGLVDKSALLPVDEIVVEATDDGVQVHFLAAPVEKSSKKRMVRRTYEPDDAEGE